MTPRSIKELDFTPQCDVFPSPREWRDPVLYEVMIDRFDSGLLAVHVELPPEGWLCSRRSTNAERMKNAQRGMLLAEREL